tara:strand:- start:995 stop:1426 length:432 start_codon:yes stop_codon:yes gene_type:complete
MASITYGWDLEIILRALDISNNFSEVTTDSIEEHRDELHQSLKILNPKLEDYPGLDVWLMCLQDSEIDLMESKMVGISSMIGGYVPELFWSLAPNVAINDSLSNVGFESIIRFYQETKAQGIDLPAPTIHFSGWHAEKIILNT